MRSTPSRRLSLVGWWLVLSVSGLSYVGLGFGQESSATSDSKGVRPEFVEKLIERSSAAQQVEVSNNIEAQARRAEARGLLQEALEAQRTGDQQNANELFRQATTTMIEAVRMVEREQAPANSREGAFENRLESVNALLAAHTRLSEEKAVEQPTERAASDLQRFVEKKVAEAQTLRGGGMLSEAREVLDEGYLAAKLAIEELRGGDTLVHSLHFASKEEEYRYELHRNDAHRMLVQVLLRQESAQPGVQPSTTRYLEDAARGRARAEQQAAGGNYRSAINTMEASTKELVNAIRSAGIYIPN